ncbi:hypothetical protein KAM461_27550 [Aeromonas hydrophila]|nr:hypothetical protein KAM461_27550 [Aeromonas hydrophila]
MGQLNTSANNSTSNRFTFITPRVMRITILRQTRQDRGHTGHLLLQSRLPIPPPEVMAARGSEARTRQAA